MDGDYMNHILAFSNDFENKLASVPDATKQAWNTIGVISHNDLMQFAASKLNNDNEKLNIVEVVFEDSVQIYGQSNTYFGLIKNEIGTILAYVFAIPPNYETRSGVLAQQVFPVMSGITHNTISSKDMRITNRPVFIINLNEANLTPATALNITSGELLGFRYTDIYDRDIESIFMSNNLPYNIRTLSDYDNIVTINNKSKVNEIFSVDYVNKVISFQKTRLKDGIHVNNEPYWFVLKAYAALYLAKQSGFNIDITQINTLSRGNKTLDAFRDFVNKVSK